MRLKELEMKFVFSLNDLQFHCNALQEFNVLILEDAGYNENFFRLFIIFKDTIARGSSYVIINRDVLT